MAPYLLLYFFAFVLLLISALYRDNKLERKLSILLLLVMTLFAGLRTGVGIDYAHYIEQARLFHMDGDSSWELAYRVLLAAFPLIGITDQALFLVMAVLTAIFVYFFVSQHSQSRLFSIFIFLTLPPLYLSSLNISRQFVAISIFAFSLRYVFSREFFKYFTFLLVAFQFHKSAIIFLPLYFFLNQKPSLKLYLLGLLGFYCALFFVDAVVSFVGISSSYLFRTEDLEQISVKTFVFILSFVVLLLLSRKLCDQKPDSDIFVNMAFLTAIFSTSPAFVPIPTDIFWRILFYLFIAFPVVLVNLRNVIEVGFLRWLYTLLLILGVSAYYFYTVVSRGGAFQLVPYGATLSFFDLI